MLRIALGLLLAIHVSCARAMDSKEILQHGLEKAVRDTCSQFKTPELKADQIAVSVINLSSQPLIHAAVNGDERFYPASVVKLFYLVAVHQWLEDKKISDSDELRRAMHDMIVDSSNDATAYIVDLLTGTTAGPELPLAELEVWSKKRDAVTQYFDLLGFKNVNANRKPWADGPYGREAQAQRMHTPASNYLSTNDTARLLAEIALLKCVSKASSQQMLELLDREPYIKNHIPNEQATDFSLAGLPRGTRMWSKAGWTSSVRHDAILLELSNGNRYVIVTFTSGKEHARNHAIIPSLVKRIISEL